MYNIRIAINFLSYRQKIWNNFRKIPIECRLPNVLNMEAIHLCRFKKEHFFTHTPILVNSSINRLYQVTEMYYCSL